MDSPAAPVKKRGTKKNKKSDERESSAYIQLGRWVMRYKYLVAMGSGCAPSAPPDTIDENVQRERTTAFNAMVAFYPPLFDELRQTGLEDFVPQIKAVSNKIWNDLGRAGDAHRLKSNTVLYATLDHNDPQQRILLNEGNSKADRGFNHPKLARFLLPVAYLEEYDEDRT
ncbi:hypothetical protein BJV78DRAFT_1159005, partial [Lactifluus subvellereus]